MSISASKLLSEISTVLSRNGGKKYQTIRFRLLGLIPLLLFLARLRDLIGTGDPGHILWMCHLSNLVLALGLFFAWPLLVRISIPWLALGLPLWIWNMTLVGISGRLTSFGTHIGGLLIGLYALSKMRSHGKTWPYSLILYLLVQQICRVITPAELNVNIAHKMHYGGDIFFSAYWQYWVATTVMAGVFLWLVGLLLLKIFSPEE